MLDFASQKLRTWKFAKKLKKNQTPQETILWEALRSRRCQNLKFRRQVNIGPFIVVFLCMDYSLIVEVDGGIHEERKEYDQVRDNYLQEQGWKIFRFSNAQVQEELDSVLESISCFVQTKRKHSPSPGKSLSHEKLPIISLNQEMAWMEGEGVRG